MAGSEKLGIYFPLATVGTGGDSDLRVWVGCWNVAAKCWLKDCGPAQFAERDDFQSVVPPGYDLYVFGVQEAVTENIWHAVSERLRAYGCERILARRGTDRVYGRGDMSFVHPKYTGIAAWISRRAVDRGLTPMGYWPVSMGWNQGSKGGAAFAIRGGGSGGLLFVSCHLSSNTADDRALNFKKLMEGCASGLCGGENPLRFFDSVVVFGDLNYRLADKGQAGSLGVDGCEALIREHRVEDLWALDPLRGEVAAGRAFTSFQEPVPLPSFLPTYKKRPHRTVPPDRSNANWVETVYHMRFKEPFYKGGRIRLRLPSFTDRVLVHNKTDGSARGDLLPMMASTGRHHLYDSVEEWGGSDHSPVHAHFVWRRWIPSQNPRKPQPNHHQSPPRQNQGSSPQCSPPYPRLQPQFQPQQFRPLRSPGVPTGATLRLGSPFPRPVRAPPAPLFDSQSGPTYGAPASFRSAGFPAAHYPPASVNHWDPTAPVTVLVSSPERHPRSTNYSKYETPVDSRVGLPPRST
eukprot:Hpha_TRINITY_DN16339_c3_g9::TRINITY_DN16339_c3_g9_i1::g.59029::m.59029